MGKVFLKDKRQIAIANNNALYEAIFAHHDIEFQRTDLICYSLDKTPLFYSNLVTVSENWQPDKIFECIDSSFEKENWSEWSIKDSFAVLDLNKYNFSKLFDAKWFYLEAQNFTPAIQTQDLKFKFIDCASDLSNWRIAWDRDEDLGKEIFNPELLNNQKILFVAGYRGKEIVCGCLLNRSDDVLGISNFFASPDRTNINLWSETIDFVYTTLERIDIVGYGRNELVGKLTSELKFESVGNLIVWIKKRDS